MKWICCRCEMGGHHKSSFDACGMCSFQGGNTGCVWAAALFSQGLSRKGSPEDSAGQEASRKGGEGGGGGSESAAAKAEQKAAGAEAATAEQSSRT